MQKEKPEGFLAVVLPSPTHQILPTAGRRWSTLVSRATGLRAAQRTWSSGTYPSRVGLGVYPSARPPSDIMYYSIEHEKSQRIFLDV